MDRKILLISNLFLPKIGGLENMVLYFAKSLFNLGYDVTVLTPTLDNEKTYFPFSVMRVPIGFLYRQYINKADVVICFNVSLQIMPYYLLSSRPPLVFSHHSTNYDLNDQIDMKGKLKESIANYIATKNIGCSAYVSNIYKNCVTIVNCYDSDLFKQNESIEKTNDIVFVGRLVSDKGADILVKSIYNLKAQGFFPSVTIVGGGEEYDNLVSLVDQYELSDQVKFVGVKKGTELVNVLNQHKLMVVPSVWKEPFGIVALEGIACGCYVIASEGGGLSQAVGLCGTTFKNGNVAELTEKLIFALTNESYIQDQLYHHRQKHLNAHTEVSLGRQLSGVLSHISLVN